MRRPTRRSASTATPGYSQGGGAAAGAAEHAATYAPELNVKGTFAGAPPADLLEVVKAVEHWENTDTRTLTKDGRSFSEIAESDPCLRDVLTNSHYRLGTRALNAPMLVLNAAHDDTIPYDQSREMAASYCALGGADGAHAPVQFITDPMPEIAPKTAANHAVPMFSQAGTAFSWIVDRCNRVAAPNSCGSL